MKLNALLIISAVYMALIGLGHLFAPVLMSAGAVPPGASSGLIAFIRHYAALFISIAVMNWMARNAEASAARNAIVLANLVAFGLAAALDFLAVLSAAPTAALVPATVNLLLALAFFWVGRMRPSVKTG
jgi:hypothetical protein